MGEETEDRLALRCFIIPGVVIEHGIVERPLRLAVFAPKRKHASDAFYRERTVRCKAPRTDQDAVALARQFFGKLGQVSAKDCNRFLLVLGIKKPCEALAVATDIGFKLLGILCGPGTPGRANYPLILAVDIEGVLQNVQPIRLGKNIKWREQHRAVVLALLERLPARQHATGLDDVVIAPVEPIALEQIKQHESITGRHCINGERFALEVLVSLDFREDGEAEQTAVAPHEYEKIGLSRDGSFALAFHVSNDIINRCYADIELAFDQTRELKHRAGGRGELHVDATFGEVAFFLSDPDRPIEPAGENDSRDRLKVLRCCPLRRSGKSRKREKRQRPNRHNALRKTFHHPSSMCLFATARHGDKFPPPQTST